LPETPKTSRKPRTYLPADLDNQIGFQLRLAQLSVFQDLIEALKDEDLRPADVAALGLIEAHPGVRQHVIGDHLKIARPNVVSLVDSLEKRGLVERLVDAKDRRANQIRLTPKGTDVLGGARLIEARHRERLLAALEGVDIDNLMLGLRRLGQIKPAD
jgi:DNA-binding MarR family transcriptional regulator